jgi:hypothetical protein
MTTLIALATKHAVVVGADSLGTETRLMVDPVQLVRYFDSQNGFSLKLDANGRPELANFSQVFDESERMPYNQLLHVNKLFKLGALPIAVMFTGTVSLGDHTIRGLVAEFVGRDPATKGRPPPNYTVNSVATRLLKFLRTYYVAAYPQEYLEQELELLVAGYDRNQRWPTVMRVDVRRDRILREFAPGEFGIAFGGQMDWIQRIVFGTDSRNMVSLAKRSNELLNLYRDRLAEKLARDGLSVDLPEPDSFGDELRLFHNWSLEGLQSNWPDFSEQNAIDCVSFFLRIMIKAQDVSAKLPTVGGDVHIAVIRKEDGYCPVTKEVWTHEGYEVPVPEVGR